MAERPLRVFMIAGEPSGDRLGAALIRGLRAEADQPLHLSGVGGAAMAAEGLQSLFELDEITVMGVAEVLPRLRRILARIAEVAAAIVAQSPDLVVSIDAPDFGLRVAKAARARFPDGAARPLFAHYVAPSVWAWRPGRARKYAARLDHLLALLPFEPPYFHAHGLSCDFVGHPIVESMGDAAARAEAAAGFRAAHGIRPETPLLAALPGSRRGETSRLAPVFKAAIAELLRLRPDLVRRGLRVVAPLAEGRAAELLADPEPWPASPVFIDPRGRAFAEAEAAKRAALAAADAALAASGTVSLELAAACAPMVIAYRVAPATAFIVRRLVQIESATLVNLLRPGSEPGAPGRERLGPPPVPEFFQERCQPNLLAEALSELFPQEGRRSPARAAQLEAAGAALAQLGAGQAPPSRRAARSLLEALARQAR
ncbi:MAG: lipid-A-disaccharide synthase [Pseudomonadota bacterium]